MDLKFYSTLLRKWIGVLHFPFPIIYGSDIVLLDNIHSEHQKYAFSQNQVLAFLTNTVIEGIHMLPKRSTDVDQNVASESINSQISVAIFMASRTHLGTQKCIILGFSPKFGVQEL